MTTDGYPDNWPEIAEQIKRDAGYCCEKCGSPSVPRRVLTVHHLDLDKANVTYENLVALCQVCHLHVQGVYRPPQRVMWVEEWQRKRGLG